MVAFRRRNIGQRTITGGAANGTATLGDHEMPEITQSLLMELFDYNPESGTFLWKRPRSNRVRAGSEAGAVASNGCRYIYVDGKSILAHRLAWLYVYGKWPIHNLCAVDGDYLNLAISNYVEESWSETACKGKHRGPGSSGIKGVTWDKSKRLWVAYITRDYKKVFLGRYASKEAAAEAYRSAADSYGVAAIDHTARVAKAAELAVTAKQRIVWKRVLREAVGVTGWSSFAEFARDVGPPPMPSKEHSVYPSDPGFPVGPGNFVWGQRIAKAFDTKTPEGKRAYNRAYRAANPNTSKNQHLMKKFGIPLSRYQEMLLKQNGVCAICEKPELNVGRNGKVLSLAVDHCHSSGAVRSLLCLNCNQGLGSFRDDPNLMRRAIEYVHGHAQQVSLVPAGNVVPIKRKAH